jgi:hypothetical protein
MMRHDGLARSREAGAASGSAPSPATSDRRGALVDPG